MDKSASSIEKNHIEKKPEKIILKFKVVTTGDAGVGKTCVIRRIVGKNFNIDCSGTLGVDLASKIFNLDENKIVKIDFVRENKIIYHNYSGIQLGKKNLKVLLEHIIKIAMQYYLFMISQEKKVF